MSTLLAMDSSERFKVFVQHPHGDARTKSAIEATMAVLKLKDMLYPEHHRELLSICLWKLTEADAVHKHRTRFRSRAALELAGPLRHDHVFQRGLMVERLLEAPHRAKEILSNAVACTVTKAEHDALNEYSRQNPNVDGWDRYVGVPSITVIDTARGEPFAYPR